MKSEKKLNLELNISILQVMDQHSNEWTPWHYHLWHMQVFELHLKFVVIWKIKFKYLKVGEMFFLVFGFFHSHFNIDVVNIPI
jgi:hypothetical protein